MVIISENEMARPGSGPSNRRGAPLRTDRVAALGAAAKLDIEDLPSHGSHGDVLKQTVARRSLVLGLQRYSREDLERVLKAGEQLHIQVLGLASIDDDVPPKLAVQTIASISVLGALRASAAVREALAARIR